MIAVVGPNPAVDHILAVAELVPGTVHRSRSARHMAGGKPLIVARTLRRLGAETTLAVPLGGFAETDLITGACCDLGVVLRPVPIAQPTRTCVIVVDATTGSSTVINEPGPDLTAGEAAAYGRLAMETMAAASLTLGSGSLPPGLPVDFYGRLARAARDAGKRLLVDASGDALGEAVAGGAWAVKVNEHEIEALTGLDAPLAAASAVAARGVRHVVVTRGASGAVYAGEEGQFSISAAPVTAVNATGAGDAFLAALAVGLDSGSSWADAMRRASAVAGLAASRLEPDIDPSPDLDALLDRITMEPVPV